MVAIFFGTVAVNAMNDYTGSLSLQAAGLRVWRPASAGVVAVLGFLVDALPQRTTTSRHLENYLLVITYWIGPCAAVVLLDWRSRTSRIDGVKAVDFWRLPAGLNALIALVVGFVVVIPFRTVARLRGAGRAIDGATDGADIAYTWGSSWRASCYWARHPVEERASTAVPT